MPVGKSPFEKKKIQIKLVITFNWTYSPPDVPHADKYSWEISYEYVFI